MKHKQNNMPLGFIVIWVNAASHIHATCFAHVKDVDLNIVMISGKE